MSAHANLVFCAPSERERVRGTCSDVVWHDSATALVVEGLPGLILLAIGPEGGAALARWVEEHGLDGVAGVGLVGVTAPWAERVSSCLVCDERIDGDEYCFVCGCDRDAIELLPLGPLEPLRAVAERARRYCRCNGSRSFDSGVCSLCGQHRYLRFIIACAPDDGVCMCLDMAGPRVPWAYCDLCAGSGKALSSRDVQIELTGVEVSKPSSRSTYVGGLYEDGCLSVVTYTTRAALAEHGLRAVVERLTR